MSGFELPIAWPDLAKLRHFGNISKVFGRAYLVLGKNFNLLWSTFCAVGKIFIVVNGPILTSGHTDCQTLLLEAIVLPLARLHKLSTDRNDYNQCHPWFQIFEPESRIWISEGGAWSCPSRLNQEPEGGREKKKWMAQT